MSLFSEFSCRGRWRLLELEEMEKAQGPGVQLGVELLPTGSECSRIMVTAVVCAFPDSWKRSVNAPHDETINLRW